MSAWLSFIGGYAKGANEQIDEQRKKEDQYIQDRMKMAAATRLEKQKEAEKQRQELKEADLSLSALPGYAAANTAQKIALLTSPVIRDQYVKRVSAGETVNLDEMISVDPKIAQQYKTVGDYMNTVQAKPKTVAPETMEAFKNPKRAFGARVGSGEEELRQNAARFGMSPEDALGWESGAQELPSMNVGATLKESALKPSDIDGRLKLSETAILRATDMSKSADPAVKARGDAALDDLLKEHLQLKTMEKTLNGADPVTMKRVRDDLVNRARNEQDPKKKKAMEAELIEIERLENLGKRVPGEGDGKDKKPTFSELMRTANGSKAAAQQSEMGNNANLQKGSVFVDTPEGPVLRFDRELDKGLQAQIRDVGNQGVIRVIREHTDSEGRVTSMAARNVLLANGIDPDYFVKERQNQAAARQQSGGAPVATNQPAPQANPFKPTNAPQPVLPGAVQPASRISAPPVNKLKENIHTTFSNGQVWTLKNGVATKVN